LRAGRGKHFDPRVVDVFFASLDEILEIQEKFKDD
jgi:response regulator RpfG family c-di-GMP phosphodiesterase